jgi:hypothetical protein
VLELQGIVVESSVVPGNSNVCGLSQVIACEQVNEQEPSELKSILVRAEDMLMIQEVSSEEEHESFEVDHLGILNIANNSAFTFHYVLGFNY